MQEQDLGRLKPDMDVCDLSGDKVGTISRVYRHADGAVGAGGAEATAPPRELPRDEVMEVKTGFLGLGSHLYIPLSAVQDTLEDCVFVSKPKEEFEGLGWHDKPAYLDELR
jgi:hypothetical protein